MRRNSHQNKRERQQTEGSGQKTEGNDSTQVGQEGGEQIKANHNQQQRQQQQQKSPCYRHNFVIVFSLSLLYTTAGGYIDWVR